MFVIECLCVMRNTNGSTLSRRPEHNLDNVDTVLINAYVIFQCMHCLWTIYVCSVLYICYWIMAYIHYTCFIGVNVICIIYYINVCMWGRYLIVMDTGYVLIDYVHKNRPRFIYRSNECISFWLGSEKQKKKLRLVCVCQVALEFGDPAVQCISSINSSYYVIYINWAEN